MAELIRDIKPAGFASAYIDAPFDEGKGILEKNGYEVITAKDNARLRIEQGKEAKVSTWGNFVKEGVIYLPGNGAFVTRGSLVMANSKVATDAHRKGGEFYITPEQAEIILGDSVKVPYGVTHVPTDKLGENEVAVFLFGEFAQKYGAFLDEAGIKRMPLRFNAEDYVNQQTRPYTNQVWLARLDGDSDVRGYGDLYYANTVRGVRFDAEGVAPSKTLQRTYTLDQISQAFNKSGLPRLESMVVEALEANN